MNPVNRCFASLSLVVSMVLATLCASAWAAAAGGFGPLPSTQGGPRSPLLIRIVDYAGSTNGAITIDVKNPTPKAQEFTAKGIYFVPQGSADQAPQRLGAVGPFVVHGAGGGAERREQLTIGAGATRRLTLDVYCIDSHRASPSSSTAFRVAKDRVPDPLVRAIDESANKAAADMGAPSVAAPAAKSAVQSEVWRNRNSNWIKLDGEGKQEAGK
jgi:hypothetical protein